MKRRGNLPHRSRWKTTPCDQVEKCVTHGDCSRVSSWVGLVTNEEYKRCIRVFLITREIREKVKIP